MTKGQLCYSVMSKRRYTFQKYLSPSMAICEDLATGEEYRVPLDWLIGE